MKLHRLSFAALGPFASPEVIDLDEVSAGGLFLLEGPTGAGKSTILDAITFALYGNVAGRSASKDRLHSDFATDVEPFAELDFSVGGRMYRIRRTPTYEKLKKNGSGTTTVNSKVWLWLRGSGGESQSEELISNKVMEVGAEVIRLLGGLSLEQFCQVVILPQGEFTTFLRADADQRRDVLQRLFATDHYQDMEKLGEAQRQAAKAEIAQAEQQLRDAVVALVQAMGPDRDITPEVEEFLALDSERQQSRIDEIRVVIAAEYQAAGRHEDDLRRQAERSEQEYQSVKEQHQQADRRIELEAEYARLEAAAADFAELVRIRDRGIRVQALAPMFGQREAVGRKLVDIAELAQGMRRTVEVDDVDRFESEPTVDEVLQFSARSRELVAQLAPVVAHEQALGAQLRDLDLLTDTVARHLAELELHKQDLEKLPQQLSALQLRRDELRELTAQLPGLEQAMADVENRMSAWSRLASLESVVQDRDEARRHAIDAAQAARDELQAAVERRLSGMAAELAQQLQPDEPCAVCGSIQHPNPAVSAEPIISDQTLTDLRERVEQTATERQNAEDLWSTAKAERDRCRFEAGQVDPTEEVDQRARELALARSAGVELEQVESEIARGRIAIDQAQAALTSVQVELATNEQQRDQLAADIAVNRVAIAAAQGEFASVAERSSSIAARATAADTWAQVLSELLSTRQQLADLDVGINRASIDAGCADPQEARASLRSRDELEELSERITVHEQAVAVNSAALAGIGTTVDKARLPDLELSREQCDEAQELLKQARSQLTLRENLLREVMSCIDSIHQAQQLIATTAAHTSAVIRVADALTGQGRVNSRRMTLSTYVLRERFASVVEAASRRLERISGGRYVLERDEAVSGNKKAGLGLVVLDQWSGGRRDPKTLSGGESFYTSLSLALGLADVVREEVGGVELETLFIDEGFGSLDPDALESVLEVIDSLRDGGRVVGIVSHVSELKDRIQDRVEVRRRTDGTSSVSVRRL